MLENPWILFAAALVTAFVAGIGIVAVVTIPFRLAARRAGWDPKLLGRMRRPFRVLVLLATLTVVALTALPPELADLRGVILHGLLIAGIAAGGWFLAAVVGFLFARTLSRYDIGAADNRVARRVHTQINLLRRLLVVVIAVIAAGAILLTFPGIQGLGASLLASAGVLSVVAGIAAQSTLGNVFAGVQLAFSDAIRVDDVVVVEGEWGRIEEITLTYVVVHIWDDRRLVLPSTYFTATPFQNWTRRTSELLGSVEFDVDWQVPVEDMRARLAEILDDEPLWDRRSSVLQVTDATGGRVRIRVLVTAKDAPTLWDLRCNVREELVEWLRDRQPEALPRTRVAMVDAPAPAKRAVRTGKRHEGVFSGSDDAETRASAFTGAIPVPGRETGDGLDRDGGRR